jgi:two-component system, NarL family, nitrate/nitrite response regulator NarL
MAPAYGITCKESAKLAPRGPSAPPLKSPGQSDIPDVVVTAESILIIEDHPRVGAGMSRELSAAGFDVALVPTVEEALPLLSSKPFGVVLLDLLLPGMHGLDGLGLIKSKAPSARIVIVTGTATIDMAVACMKRGADDVLTKPFEPEAIIEVVQSVLGRVPSSSDGGRADGQNAQGGIGERLARAAATWSLSKRQAQVLGTLAHGTSNKDIAHTLGCSESTVELHITALLKKSGAASRTELVARFWMLGNAS